MVNLKKCDIISIHISFNIKFYINSRVNSIGLEKMDWGLTLRGPKVVFEKQRKHNRIFSFFPVLLGAIK